MLYNVEMTTMFWTLVPLIVPQSDMSACCISPALEKMSMSIVMDGNGSVID